MVFLNRVSLNAAGLKVNDDQYADIYSVSSSGVPSSAAFPGTSYDGHALGDVSFETFTNISDGATANLAADWVIVNSTLHCVSYGIQYNQTSSDILALDFLCKVPSGTYAGDYEALVYSTYVAASGSSNNGVDNGTFYFYNTQGPAHTQLSELSAGVRSQASTYNASTNSTLKALGIQEGYLSVALAIMASKIPSNLSGVNVVSTGLYFQSATVCSGVCPNYVIGVNDMGGQVAQEVAWCVGGLALSIGVGVEILVAAAEVGVVAAGVVACVTTIILCVLIAVAFILVGTVANQAIAYCEGAAGLE